MNDKRHVKKLRNRFIQKSILYQRNNTPPHIGTKNFLSSFSKYKCIMFKK